MVVFKYKAEMSDKGVVRRPIADVYIKSKKGEWIEFHPYIDSGADVTLIPLSMGKLIGLKVEGKDVEQIGGIRGSVPVVYQKCLMRIGEKELNVPIGWALVEEVPPLLGRMEVFDQFNVTFRQKEGVVVFE